MAVASRSSGAGTRTRAQENQLPYRDPSWARVPMEMNMWYIDAWSVWDGLAFASERMADTIQSSATVFLSVPDLEPIPVGRISTALRATRASFQDGFHDESGSEFGFVDLEQVREVVRRAYLG